MGNTTTSNLLNSVTIVYLYVRLTIINQLLRLFFKILRRIIESQRLIRHKLQTGLYIWLKYHQNMISFNWLEKFLNRTWSKMGNNKPIMSLNTSMSLNTLNAPLSKIITSKKSLLMVRSVLNRTGKIIKKFSDFYFLSYHWKLGWFFQKNDTKMTITQKIKIRYLIFLSIQLIRHLSWEFEHFWIKMFKKNCSNIETFLKK